MVALWEKLKNLFLKSKESKENIDYKFIDINDDLMGIELLKDPYKGVQYYYLTVNFKEDPDEGVLSFTFNLIIPDDFLYNDKDFKQLIGNVLKDIILNLKGENG